MRHGEQTERIAKLSRDPAYVAYYLAEYVDRFGVTLPVALRRLGINKTRAVELVCCPAPRRGLFKSDLKHLCMHYFVSESALVEILLLIPPKCST